MVGAGLPAYAAGVHDGPSHRRLCDRRTSVCGCAPDCWCNRRPIGRLVKWWFPCEWFGIHHKDAFPDGLTDDQIQQWKHDQDDLGVYPRKRRRAEAPVLARLLWLLAITLGLVLAAAELLE